MRRDVLFWLIGACSGSLLTSIVYIIVESRTK